MKKCKESNLYIDKTVILIIEVRHVIIKKKKKKKNYKLEKKGRPKI